MTIPNVGLDVGGLVIDLYQLEQEIKAAAIPLSQGLTMHGPPPGPPDPKNPPWVPGSPQPPGTMLYTHDDQGNPIDLPPEAEAIVRVHTPA